MTGPEPGDFRSWLARLQPDLRRLASSLSSTAADAADLAQATSLRALEKERYFIHGSSAELRRWLVRIMVNLHYDQVRKGTRELPVGWLDEIAATEPVAPPAWSYLADDEVAAAVERLRPHLREAYHLFAVQRASYAAISTRLHIPLSTVATRIYRARIHLRQTLLAGGQRAAA